MKVSISKPYWSEPIEDEVESVTITRSGAYGMKIVVQGGKLLGDGEIADTQFTVTVTS